MGEGLLTEPFRHGIEIGDCRGRWTKVHRERKGGTDLWKAVLRTSLRGWAQPAGGVL